MSDRLTAFLGVVAAGLGNEQDIPIGAVAAFIRACIPQLRMHYRDVGAPYGDDDVGFQRWLGELRPAPPMA